MFNKIQSSKFKIQSSLAVYRLPSTACRLLFLLSCLSTLLLVGCSIPRASFTHSDTNYEAPAMVEFENTSTGAEIYEWNFGDGNVSDTISPIHQYKNSGNYLVTLKAEKGEKSTVYQQYIAVRAPQDCTVKLETEFGDMTLVLFDDTPEHRDNFLKLISQQYYDGVLFHRVIPGFMIQGGDPDSRGASQSKRIGTGGPGYTVPAEFSPQGVHVRGALAAARDNNPEKASSGSQFYIVHGSNCTDERLDKIEQERGFRYTPEQREAYLKTGGTPQLDREYTVFGMLIDGFEILDKIATSETKNDRPTKNISIKIREVY